MTTAAWITRWPLAALLVAGLAMAGAAQAQGERRVALGIGNAAYRDAPLRNPINGARAMAKALSETGFSVTKLETADRLAMQRAILAFGRDLSRDAVGLFYYAGHGMQVRGSHSLRAGTPP